MKKEIIIVLAVIVGILGFTFGGLTTTQPQTAVKKIRLNLDRYGESKPTYSNVGTLPTLQGINTNFQNANSTPAIMPLLIKEI